MQKVAITGNIASGKTKVEEILREKGFKVLDTDVLAHDLLKKTAVKKEIIATFFGFDILEDGEISRRKMGKIVFANETLRKKLESILHPLIKKEIGRFFQQCECIDPKSLRCEKIAFVSIPLLFEAKFESLFDKIILVYAEDEIRLERLMKRNNLPEEYAQNRIKIQISQDKKTSLADYIIYNDKSLDDLRNNVEKVIELIL